MPACGRAGRSHGPAPPGPPFRAGPPKRRRARPARGVTIANIVGFTAAIALAAFSVLGTAAQFLAIDRRGEFVVDVGDAQPLRFPVQRSGKRQ